jgi:1,4-dihydroxy-6-naphthoate synthase
MQNNPISIGYSTCPNDTFIFCNLAQQPDVEPHLHDVETLNRWAFEGKLDVTKLSFHAWLLVQDQYELLRAGAALGRGCGPLVVSRGDAIGPDSVVAVPGEFTTAHLLLRLWNPAIKKRIFMPFDRIMEAVESGAADAGVIIHEGRFIFEERGFCCLQDLGEWWESETGRPIPLGCIAAKKSLGAERISEMEVRLAESIRAAFDDPDSTRDYVKAHAQEMDDAVLLKHIETYVNDFSLDLGAEGLAAVRVLQDMAQSAGVL